MEQAGSGMLASMANNSPTGLWMSDEAGQVTFINQTLVEWTGMPAEELAGSGWLNAIIESDRPARKQAYADAIKARTHYSAEFRLKKADNSIIWCRAEGAPFYSSDGKYAGFTGYCMDVHDQKSIGRQLLKEREELFSLFEDSPVGIAMIDRDNLTFTMANPFYLELVGRRHDELINKSLLDALPELKGQGFDILLNTVIDTGKPFIAKEVEVSLNRNGNKETFYVDLTYKPRKINGAIAGVLVIATDVTQQVVERRKTEESETKLKGIIAAAPAGIGLFVGRDLIIEYPNQTFIDIVGKGPEIEGLPLREAMPELITEGQPFLKILDDVFTTGKMFQSFGSQVKIVQNGVMTYNYYNITYTPVFDDEGKVYAILDIAIDVTDQILAQQKLEETEKELSGAVQLAGLANWSYDIKSDTYSYSPQFMSWLGFTDKTVSAEYAFEPVPEEMKQVVISKVKEAIQSETGAYDFEHPIVNTKTGEQRIIHAQAQVFYDADRNPLVLKGTAQDITERKTTETALNQLVSERTTELGTANSQLSAANADLGILNNQLLRSNEELGQYAYVVSHDLQEPLRKIQIFADKLMNLETVASDSHGLSGKIFDAAGRMSVLIKDLLDFSQIMQTNSSKTDVDLNDIIQKIQEDFEVVITEKKALITSEDLPKIRAVPLQMHQLFYNLIGNALKFSAAGISPRINISTTVVTKDELPDADKNKLAEGKYYKIDVQDNGIGFSKEYSEKIFDVFSRLHTKKDYSGSGIGLALCKRIAEKHDGLITVTSSEDSGSTFSVLLPKY